MNNLIFIRSLIQQQISLPHKHSPTVCIYLLTFDVGSTLEGASREGLGSVCILEEALSLEATQEKKTPLLRNERSQNL